MPFTEIIPVHFETRAKTVNTFRGQHTGLGNVKQEIHIVTTELQGDTVSLNDVTKSVTSTGIM
jgi:hypothetical protein